VEGIPVGLIVGEFDGFTLGITEGDCVGSVLGDRDG